MRYFVSGIFFLFLLFFFGVAQKDPFSKKFLIKCQKETITPFNFPQLQEITSKPLHYLGKGEEAVAFVSADDQYVIKFFLTRPLVRKTSFHPKKRLRQLRKSLSEIRTGEIILRRYEQGLHFLPEHTAMLAIHRYTSSENLPTCTLIDSQGKHHTIDLNEFAFVVQKKATIPTKKMFANHRHDLDSKFHDLFIALSNQGFVNLSTKFAPTNFALLEDKAIMIDLGKLEYLPEKAYKLGEEYFQYRYEQALIPNANQK